MSKIAIALLVTWIVIGLAAASYGGYYYGKKQGEKSAKNQCNSTEKVITPTVNPGSQNNPDSGLNQNSDQIVK